MVHRLYMQAQEILKEVHDLGVVGNGFWYVYSLTVTTLLVLLIVSIIWLVKGFLAKFQDDIKQTHAQFAESIRILTNTTNDLHTLVRIHENDIAYLKDDIEELKGARPKKR